MEGTIFITAAEMAEILGISKPYAYKIIKQMNEDLEANGFITISGKVSKKYFEEKFYGVETAQGKEKRWQLIRIRREALGMSRSIIMTGLVKTSAN